MLPAAPSGAAEPPDAVDTSCARKRACYDCHAAKMLCSGGFPCARCIRRGRASVCQERPNVEHYKVRQKRQRLESEGEGAESGGNKVTSRAAAQGGALSVHPFSAPAAAPAPLSAAAHVAFNGSGSMWMPFQPQPSFLDSSAPLTLSPGPSHSLLPHQQQLHNTPLFPLSPLLSAAAPAAATVRELDAASPAAAFWSNTAHESSDCAMWRRSPLPSSHTTSISPIPFDHAAAEDAPGMDAALRSPPLLPVSGQEPSSLLDSSTADGAECSSTFLALSASASSAVSNTALLPPSCLDFAHRRRLFVQLRRKLEEGAVSVPRVQMMFIYLSELLDESEFSHLTRMIPLRVSTSFHDARSTRMRRALDSGFVAAAAVAKSQNIGSLPWDLDYSASPLVSVDDDQQAASLAALAMAAELARVPRPQQQALATMQTRRVPLATSPAALADSSTSIDTTGAVSASAAAAPAPCTSFAPFDCSSGPAGFDAVKQRHVSGCANGIAACVSSTLSSLALCDCPSVIERRISLQCNREWERLFGYSQLDLRQMTLRYRGNTHMRLYAAESIPVVLESFADALLQNISDWSDVVIIRTKFGAHVRCVRRVHLALGPDGDVTGSMETFLPV